MKKAISQATILAHEEIDSSLESEGRRDEQLNHAIDTTVIELALPISASPSDDPILCIGSSSDQVLAETEPEHEEEANDIHE